MNTEITINNYKSELPQKKWSMYLWYIEHNWGLGKECVMFYNKERDVFDLEAIKTHSLYDERFI